MYHSITFWDGVSFYSRDEALSAGDQNLTGMVKGINTWTDWHLIPAEKPSIASPSIITNYLEYENHSGSFDMTENTAPSITYGDRIGELEFYVDNDHESWTAIRKKIAAAINGKIYKIVLEDDPTYYYEGRFVFKDWKSEANNSMITIKYQLAPYRHYVMDSSRFGNIYWDPFNFETDYDYTVGGGSNYDEYFERMKEGVL